MFAGRFSSSLGLVGIDYGAQSVKMLQVREHGGSLHVVGAARVDCPLATPLTLTRASDRPMAQSAPPGPGSAPGEAAPQSPAIDAKELAAQIRAGLAAGGFSGRRCVVSLGRGDVCLQSVRLPKMPDQELRESVLWEASQRFGLDRNAMQVDFIRTGALTSSGQGVENREEIILVATSQAVLEARLEPLLLAGLRPVAVETSFTATVRALSRKVRREADRTVVRAIVEIGSTGSMALITRGDQIALCKPIAISGQLFNKAVAEHLQMDEPAAAELRASRIAAASSGQSIHDQAADRAVFEAVRPLMGDLVKEVTLCLRYYGVTFRGNPPTAVILTGGDGLEPRLAEMMSKSVKMDVTQDDASSTLTQLVPQIHSSLNRMPGPAGCWTTAMGLSMRGMGRRNARRDANEGGAVVGGVAGDAA